MFNGIDWATKSEHSTKPLQNKTEKRKKKKKKKYRVENDTKEVQTRRQIQNLSITFLRSRESRLIVSVLTSHHIPELLLEIVSVT